MSVKIISNKYDEMAVLYCSTTDWAFGPVFYAEKDISAYELAQEFIRWLKNDAEESLEKQYEQFRNLNWKRCPTCYVLIPGRESKCEQCLAEEPLDKAMHGEDWDGDEVTPCLKCVCMTKTMKDGMCGKCKRKKSK